ncbi:MAG TPA: hypothetical protein VF662_01170 [Allosphingosinicella sp.]|jgi:hypothetical protein
MNGEDWWRVLPVLSALASIVSAVLVYRFTHRHSIRSNTERWLDCVRDDVAELVAVHVMILRLPPPAPPQLGKASPKAPARAGDEGAAKLRLEWGKQREMLQVRLRLRLTKRTHHHRRLINAVGPFLTCRSEKDIEPAREEVEEAACAVVGETWGRIKRG